MFVAKETNSSMRWRQLCGTLVTSFALYTKQMKTFNFLEALNGDDVRDDTDEDYVTLEKLSVGSTNYHQCPK